LKITKPSRITQEHAKPVRTKINDHPMVAGLAFLTCLLPTSVYYEAFGKGGFNSSDIPWKIALIFLFFIPAVFIIHYIINRRQCRLWWEGVAALFGVLAVWLLLGAWSFFYFGFAPMPQFERIIGLLVCLGGTTFWLISVWRDYVKIDRKEQLRESLFVEESDRIVYSGTASDAVVMCLPQRNPFTRVHVWLVLFFGPFLGGILLVVLKLMPQSSGPHAMFLLVSFLSFPLSQWILGYLGVRTAYFHIYLAFWLERRTGKRVFLGP
jgi:hypothetical protein